MAADHTAAADAWVARPVAVLAGLVLLGTGAYGAGFWLTHDEGPTAAQVEAGAARIRAEHRPGDLILLQPFYATRAREYLGDLHPLAVRDPLAEDFDRHPRVWVLGLFGAGEALRADFRAAHFDLVRSDTPAPGVTVDLYENQDRAEVVYDFRARLKDARVYHENGATRTECAKWLDTNQQGGKGYGRWSCPQNSEWFYVAPEWHRMGDHLRLCLWAHPPSQGRLVVQYPNVPLTGQLFGHAGHTLNGSVNARAPIDLDVAIGDAPPQRFTFALEETWRPFSMPTATATTSTVTFAVSTSDAGVNHFCFVADTRRRAPSPADPGGTP